MMVRRSDRISLTLNTSSTEAISALRTAGLGSGLASKKRLPLLLLVIVAAGFSACKGNGSSAGGKQGARSIVVRMAPVVARDVVYEVKALGSLEPEELVQITAEVGGAVKEVLFNAGDRVTAETVLARIDPERYRLEAERAASAHRRAVADWKRAESDQARRESLAKENLITVEELTRSRQESERLAADAAEAKAALEIAVQNRDRSSVRVDRDFKRLILR